MVRLLLLLLLQLATQTNWLTPSVLPLATICCPATSLRTHRVCIIAISAVLCRCVMCPCSIFAKTLAGETLHGQSYLGSAARCGLQQFCVNKQMMSTVAIGYMLCDVSYSTHIPYRLYKTFCVLCSAIGQGVQIRCLVLCNRYFLIKLLKITD